MPSPITATVSVMQDLSKLLPYVGSLLRQTDDSAFDTWRQTPINRLYQLQAEIDKIKAENPEIEVRLTDNEKYSPISGINKVIYEYTFGVDEEKVCFLKNALLNGAYGDYSLELREDLLQIIVVIQPLDIQIIQYLLTIAPNPDCYHSKYNDAELRKKEVGTGTPEYTQIVEEYHAYEKQLFFDTIHQQFSSHPIAVIRRSLDRLQYLGLIYNIGANRWGKYNPYFGFVPLEMAQMLIDFILDSRNTLANQENRK